MSSALPMNTNNGRSDDASDLEAVWLATEVGSSHRIWLREPQLVLKKHAACHLKLTTPNTHCPFFYQRKEETFTAAPHAKRQFIIESNLHEIIRTQTGVHTSCFFFHFLLFVCPF